MHGKVERRAQQMRQHFLRCSEVIDLSPAGLNPSFGRYSPIRQKAFVLEEDRIEAELPGPVLARERLRQRRPPRAKRDRSSPWVLFRSTRSACRLRFGRATMRARAFH